MKIHLATASDFRWNARGRAQFESGARLDRVGQHTLTDDAALADLILFIDFHQHSDDWWMGRFHRHPLVKKYPEKIVVYDERDQPWFNAPGVYVSLARDSPFLKSQASGCYFNLKTPPAPDPGIEPDLLFSFMGAMSHPIRREIVRLRHPRAIVEDTSHFNFFVAHDEIAQERVRRQRELYGQVTARSKFVLCPRGSGTASFRLFETLSLGRVPVILSDDWVETPGPDWASCAVRVPQSEIAQLPALLEAREAEFQTLAANARATWEAWFAPPVRFHHLIETCRALKAASAQNVVSRPQLRAPALRHLVRLRKKRLQKQLRRR